MGNTHKHIYEFFRYKVDMFSEPCQLGGCGGVSHPPKEMGEGARSFGATDIIYVTIHFYAGNNKKK